jgi:hypothetical protein
VVALWGRWAAGDEVDMRKSARTPLLCATTTEPTTTTSTTTTTEPTTTTSTTTTTEPTTTTSTTTTTEPTTTTSTTTTAPPGKDYASVRFRGALDYVKQGFGQGIVVRRDALGVRRVSGTLTIPGDNGGEANVAVSVQRAWILPLWIGEVKVVDAANGFSSRTPVFGPVSVSKTGAVGGELSWFIVDRFPALFRPYTLRWSVIDGG